MTATNWTGLQRHAGVRFSKISRDVLTHGMLCPPRFSATFFFLSAAGIILDPESFTTSCGLLLSSHASPPSLVPSVSLFSLFGISFASCLLN